VTGTLCNIQIKIHRKKNIDFIYRFQHFREADLRPLRCLLHAHELDFTGPGCVGY
jgi:hypothetical protein